MEEWTNCPDCDVPPGTVHNPWCDVARCVTHRTQHLCCDGPHDDCVPDTWTGQWPWSDDDEDPYGYDDATDEDFDDPPAHQRRRRQPGQRLLPPPLRLVGGAE